MINYYAIERRTYRWTKKTLFISYSWAFSMAMICIGSMGTPARNSDSEISSRSSLINSSTSTSGSGLILASESPMHRHCLWTNATTLLLQYTSCTPRPASTPGSSYGRPRPWSAPPVPKKITFFDGPGRARPAAR